MPDDTVELEAAPQTESAATSQDGGVQPDVAASMTAEQISSIIREAAGGSNAAVLDAVQNLQGLIQQQAQANAPAPVEPVERAEAYLTDPDKLVDERVNEVLRSQLAPVLSRNLEVDRDERVETRAKEVDEQFGEGYFNEHIRPRLTGPDGNLAAYPINQQADPRVIDGAVRGIMGNMLMDPEQGPLVREAMDKAAKARQERDVRQPVNMMGPGRASGQRTNVLTPEFKDALAGFQDAGVKISEQDLKDAMNKGRSLSDWLPKEASQ